MKSVRLFTVVAFILMQVAHSFTQIRHQVFTGLNLKHWREEYARGLKQQPAQDPIGTRQRLARLAAFDGKYVEAEKYLREVMALDARNFTAHNNLGNVYFLQARLDSAAAHYSRARSLAKTADDSLGIRLNLGAYFHAIKDDALAAETIAEALRGPDDLLRVERLLPLKFDAIDFAKAGSEQSESVSASSMKNLVMQACNVQQKKPPPKTKPAPKPPPKKTKTPGQQGQMPPKNKIGNVFFWAQ